MNEYCGTYFLKDDHTYEKCSVGTWGKQQEKMREDNTKHVAMDEIENKRISTVWLGIDHNSRQGPPLLFETMIFVGDTYNEIYCDRYSTWDKALEGHKKAIQWVLDGCKDE